MARQESDREDLMREAVAFVRRAEFANPETPEAEPIVAGFRRDGSLSIYFGADPVVQFNLRGELRRVYLDGFLYRTQGQTLAKLERQRSEQQTVLLREDLTPEQLGELRQTIAGPVRQLLEDLQSGILAMQAQVPAEADVREELLACLPGILASDFPLAPAIPGRK